MAQWKTKSTGQGVPQEVPRRSPGGGAFSKVQPAFLDPSDLRGLTSESNLRLTWLGMDWSPLSNWNGPQVQPLTLAVSPWSEMCKECVFFAKCASCMDPDKTYTDSAMPTLARWTILWSFSCCGVPLSNFLRQSPQPSHSHSPNPWPVRGLAHGTKSACPSSQKHRGHWKAAKLWKTVSLNIIEQSA